MGSLFERCKCLKKLENIDVQVEIHYQFYKENLPKLKITKIQNIESQFAVQYINYWFENDNLYI